MNDATQAVKRMMKQQTDIDVPLPPPDRPVVVAAFYRFVALPDFEAVQASLQKFCDGQGILGTILLAPEGINGTVSGNHQALVALRIWLEDDARFAGLMPKYSFADAPAFYRMKVRLKQEIVTMGQADIDPENSVGTYVTPDAWNAAAKSGFACRPLFVLVARTPRLAAHRADIAYKGRSEATTTMTPATVNSATSSSSTRSTGRSATSKRSSVTHIHSSRG